jgi:uncharacterized protein
MWSSRAITAPFGLSVFGSAQKRVEPDYVSVIFTVSRLEKTPTQAFQSAKTGAAQVKAFISKSRISEFGASQIQLEQTKEFANQKYVFTDYTASVTFNLVIRDLTQFENILSGIVDSGANEINSVAFNTDQLKAVRREMRELAVKEAIVKADVYCKAANVKLGKIIHIEDVNPDEANRSQGMHGSSTAHWQESEEDFSGAINPASILVRGAVLLGFALE